MTETPILAAPDKAVDSLPIVWDPNTRVGEMLKGKRGLVIGVANADSIAYGCAAKLRAWTSRSCATALPNAEKNEGVQLLDASLSQGLGANPGLG